jgi:hypothetical protein
MVKLHKKTPLPHVDDMTAKGLKDPLDYLVPETEVLWSPITFPMIPRTDVQSAGVEWMLVILTLGPLGTNARAADWSSSGIAFPMKRKQLA